MRLLRSLRRRLQGDGGVTLIEISMVVGLMGIVIAALMATMNSAQNNVAREVTRGESNDQLRLAFQAVDREVRSGNVLYDPSTESYSAGDVAAGMSLRIYTQSNGPTRGGSWCVQWRITADRELQQRRWTPFWTDYHDTTQVFPWHTVATGVSNRADGISAFSRIGNAGNLISVRLRANADATGKKGSTVEVRQAISGRNTQFYPATTSCGPAVPDPNGENPVDHTKVPPY